MTDQLCIFGDNPDYDNFVTKFKPKKTTDDCYTPPLVYDTIRDYACVKYGIDPGSIVRPFYPGGDYEAFAYPTGCVVLDNPPFSIFSKICEFYIDRGIQFFLFAPSLTSFSGQRVVMRMAHIICDASIEYDNGAIVRTSFVTNLAGDVIAQTEPELTRLINNAVSALRRNGKQELPVYEYPDHVVTAALLQKYSKYCIDWKILSGECVPISKLDSQKAEGKTIFGGGLLLSDQQAKKHADVRRAAAERAAAERAAAERAAAERAAAERAAVQRWELSPREIDLIKSLSRYG